jgi:serine/threonine protein phosphatase PrpC
MQAPPPSKTIRLDCASVSAIGMRPSNQDHIGLAEQDDMSCFIVADGAGGHQGGEVASRVVVEALLAKFGAESSFGARALLSYVEHASEQLALAREGKPELADMSTTVAALLVDQVNARAVWAHLGDTRIYLFRAGRLFAVTRDHSLTQQLIDAGYARADELRAHPQRNILLAAIGTAGESGPIATEQPVELEDGDACLLCTDGLWEWILEDQMEQALAATPDSQAWLTAMCAIADEAARQSGKARDNYSAYAIRVRKQKAQP